MSGFGSLGAFNYHGLGNVSTVADNDKALTLNDLQRTQKKLMGAQSQPTQEQRLIDIEKKLDMLINQLAPEMLV